MLPNFAYVRAGSLKEAIEHLASEGAVLHAGGTDLLTCLHDRVFNATKLVSIRDLENLRGIGETADGGMRIGSLATVTEVSENPLIGKRYPALAQAASEVASPQLRNQGTIGGNLCQKPRCWYYRGEFHCLRKGGETCFALYGENQFHCIFGGDGCYIVHPSDTAPALVALDARVTVAGGKGTRTIAVEQLHMPPSRDPRKETVLQAGEIITEILLPPPGHGLKSSYRKVRARRSWDFALAGAAVALRWEGETVRDAKMVLSGAAPIPWRSRDAEEIIVGRKLDEDTVYKASEAVINGAEPLEKNAYKIPLFKKMIQEELLKLAGLQK